MTGRILRDLRPPQQRTVEAVKPRQRVTGGKPRMKYYWAYGSNLSMAAMARRCPGAIKVGPLSLDDGALVFRGVADVVTRKGSRIEGGLWLITPDNERVLDAYEGVGAKFYLKRYLTIEVKGKPRDCLFYQMAISVGVMPPGERYLDTIVQGYKDFGLDLQLLDAALHEAWGTKKVTARLAERHKKRGQKLAQPSQLFSAY